MEALVLKSCDGLDVPLSLTIQQKSNARDNWPAREAFTCAVKKDAGSHAITGPR